MFENGWCMIFKGFHEEMHAKCLILSGALSYTVKKDHLEYFWAEILFEYTEEMCHMNEKQVGKWTIFLPYCFFKNAYVQKHMENVSSPRNKSYNLLKLPETSLL